MKITRINSVKIPNSHILSAQKQAEINYLQTKTEFAPSFEGGLSPRVYLDKIKALKQEMLAFPRDIEYRKNLMINAGKNPEEAYKIRSIIGLDEIKSIMAGFNEHEEAYVVGEADKNIKNKTMRANLHIHTLASDGIAPVKERLDQAASYADEVAKNPEFKKEPFTIAITDHDTTDGLKEAIEIISSDPIKYRNLRVILGVEMTTYNNIATDILKEATNTHILVYGVDPNNKKFDTFINETKRKKQEIASKMIEQANQSYKSVFGTEKLFSLEGAKNYYNPLKKGILGIHNYVSNYIYTKAILTQVVLKNPSLVKELKEHNLPLETDELMEELRKFYYTIDGNNKPRRVSIAISQFFAQKLGVEPEKMKEIIGNLPKSQQYIDFSDNLKADLEQYKRTLVPKYDYMPTIESVFDLVKEDENAMVGIAHPLSNVEKTKETAHRYAILTDLYNKFKQAGGDKAGFSEFYYQSYTGELKNFQNSEETKKLLANFSETLGMYKTGSLDSHGESVFRRY